MADLRIGGRVNPADHTRTDTNAAVPSGELTTHAVIVGMTGSGKTGLGVDLIEECLAAGVPAILIDPKGDLTNLALTFPELSGPEFAPWVNDSDVEKSGSSREEFAAAQAQLWTSGLADWELGPADVKALHDGVEVRIYTPGATHGIPLNIVGSLKAPAPGSDPTLITEEIDAYCSSLLNLIGVDADPLSSREHILLANIIADSWNAGRDLDLAGLVAAVQQPPIRKVGVLELDAFFPAADRGKFAMKLNGLLASPSFATWLQGDPIDIGSLLRSPDGRPRAAVITTSHLSDEQRQSVTAMVLAKLITWMRQQSGTGDLRALLYMDEVAGYLPPTANPPTKAPIMLLLKQARAFGIGVVLSTQNPVDVDYKALSNAGTWLVGRLQTEQDKARLLSGLSSAAGTIDVDQVSATISGLAKREFVLKRASQDKVDVITTRWAMSYLRGPLTREQISSLKPGTAPAPDSAPAPAAPLPDAAATPQSTGQEAAPASAGAQTPEATTTPVAAPDPTAAATAPAAAAGAPVALGDDETPVAPTIAAGVPVRFLDPGANWTGEFGVVPGSRLRGAVMARVTLRYDDAKAGIRNDQEYECVLFPIAERVDPASWRSVDYDDRDLLLDPPPGAVYQLLPSVTSTKTWWNALERELADHLARNQTLKISANPALKLYSRVDETPEDFAARCQAAAADQADKAVAALRTKYEKKLATVQRRLDTANTAVDRTRQAQSATYQDAAMDTVGSMLGGIFGGRRSRTSVTSTANKAMAARNKVAAAESKANDVAAEMAGLEEELANEITALSEQANETAAQISQVDITLAKSDVKVIAFSLVWFPFQ